MASVRNLPYEFGANYETVIKIIGSKYVRCLVEKSDGKAKEIVKSEAQSMLQTLPLHNIRQRNGKYPDRNKPPGQQINNDVNIESQNKDGVEKYTSKQTETNVIRSVDNKEQKPLNLYCVTAPCGDKSLSYIHSIKKPSFEAQNSLQQQEFELHPISLTTLANLNEELKEKDPRKSGFLSQAQLSTLLLKHDIPLQLPTVKLLFKQCSQANDQELVENICQKHGLILHPGMMETLANLCDFGRRGRMQWKPFVELLKKVQTGMNPALLVCKRRNEEKTEDNSQIKEQYKLQTANPWNSYDVNDSEGQEAWIDRFRKMEKALYLSDVKNTGKLEKEKAKRLIHNYNQIYDLCLSPLKIDKAFRPFHYHQDMPLEPLLQYLKEL
ncbi:hypothetical protein E2320_010336 [Naja naja]|nr:hypothetical protein E2320_010336 [Naja naja]